MKYEKWQYAAPNSRFITMSRPGDTERLDEAVSRDKPDPRYFVMGPELPGVSSTRARDALNTLDTEVLHQLLNPGVKQWCIDRQAFARAKQSINLNFARRRS